MLVTSSHFWSLVPNNTFLSQDADCVESRVRQFQCRCPRQVLQRIPTGETSDEVFLGWLVARDAFPKNYGNPTKHKEGDHIELLASWLYVYIYIYIYIIYIYHVLVGILHFEIPLGEYESWVNNNMFRHNLYTYVYILKFHGSNAFFRSFWFMALVRGLIDDNSICLRPVFKTLVSLPAWYEIEVSLLKLRYELVEC